MDHIAEDRRAEARDELTAILQHAPDYVEARLALGVLMGGEGETEAARRLGLTARTLSNKMKIWRQAGLVG